ncbi:MAG: hypothetical protein J2P26_11115 [Nocardiopsaceae bacterium]|nr:hypothetical protein [Nocardiopsaceae bacterium]
MSTEIGDLIERATRLRATLNGADGSEAGGPVDGPVGGTVGSVAEAAGRLLAARRNLPAADRKLLAWWRDDAVRGVFEVSGGEISGGGTAGAGTAGARVTGAGSELELLNLIDDLTYRVHGFTATAPPGPGPPGQGPMQPGSTPPAPGMFASGTLLPLTSGDTAWLAAGDEIVYPAADGRRVARLAMEAATAEPDLVFRNPDKAAQGWEHMRKDREEFLSFFGTDELVLPTAEAESRLNAYYGMRRDALASARGRHRQVSEAGETTFVMPPGFFEFDTVGIIYDETEGFVVVPEYGALRELFADPALAADAGHAEVLKAYLNSDAIPPLPLRRMAAAHPAERVDAVYRRVLGNRNFMWAQNGEALLRKRKPFSVGDEPTPGVAVLSDRLLELARGGTG